MPEMNDPAYWNMLIRRSLTRLYLLAALAEKPMHGYELARAVTELCQGCCDPSDAVIYPVLKELAEGGYCVCEVESKGGRQRKVCELTDRGREALRVAADAWTGVLPSLRRAIEVAEAATPGKISLQALNKAE
jgi:PadR family transcriptional regulator, regulatory protein PadR